MNEDSPGTVNAFICGTPYQVLQAIAIARTMQPHVESDIFLSNHSQGVESLALRLREIGAFRCVRVGHTQDLHDSFSKGRARSRLSFARYSLTYRRTIRTRLRLDETVYTDVYFTTMSITVQLALMVLYDNNPLLRVHMYEDGTGSYREGSVDIRLSPWTRAFLNCMGHGFLSGVPHTFLVNRPELVRGRMASIASPMPRIDWEDRALVADLNHMFDFDTERDIPSERVVYFDQPHDQAPNIAGVAMGLVRESCPADVVVKPHPRGRNPNNSGIRTMRNSGVPWELIVLNSDVEAKVLVSICSTACLTPKLMFDLEPRIMLLSRVPEIRESYAPFVHLDRFILDVQALYRDSSRVSIPTSLDEARDVMSHWVR